MSDELRPAHEWLVGRILEHIHTLVFERNPGSRGRPEACHRLDEDLDGLDGSIIPADKMAEVIDKLRSHANVADSQGEDGIGDYIRERADELERRPVTAPPVKA